MVWEIGSPLIDVRRSGHNAGMLKQILASSRHDRLLVSTGDHDTLWPMPHPAGEDSLCQIKCETIRSWKDIGPYWKTCLCPRSSSDVLLSIDGTGKTIKIYDWTTVKLLRAVPVSPGLDLSLDRFAALSDPSYFATYATNTSTPKNIVGEKPTAAVLLWDYKDLEGADSQPPAPRWELRMSILPAQVAHLIGAFGTRLVFYTTDHWIASFELIPPDSPSGAIVAEGSFVRHFFLPNHWVGSTRLSDMRFGISSEGEIIFDRQGELAVIKRGLEVTEDGAPFQPRQLSSRTKAHFGARIPYREAGMSLTCLLQTKDSGCLVDREG
jgi:hypothetical protein